MDKCLETDAGAQEVRLGNGRKFSEVQAEKEARELAGEVGRARSQCAWRLARDADSREPAGCPRALMGAEQTPFSSWPAQPVTPVDGVAGPQVQRRAPPSLILRENYVLEPLSKLTAAEHRRSTFVFSTDAAAS